MRKIFTLLFTAISAVVCTHAQVNVDMGKDWDPDTPALINAASGVYFVPAQKEYTVNPGADNEVVFTVGGAATAQPSANKDVYANPTTESFSYVQIGSNQTNGTWFEGSATGPKVISAIKINGTSGSVTVAVTGGILYSDQAPFNENSIIGYGEVPLTFCRAGNAGVIIDNVPAGAKSFRIYNPAKIVVSGSGYALSTDGEDIITVGDAAQSFRVAYVNLTLGDGAPPTDPTLAKVSGDTEQTFYLGQPVANIVYRWGGTATSASVTWDGGTTPSGITVASDADAKTVTISGTPAAAGVYKYSVVATDGTKNTDALTGTITVNTVPGGKKFVAYIATSATPTDAADIAILAKLRESYEVDIIVAAASTDANKPASTFDPYDAVVLAALPGSGNVPTCLKGLNKPLVTVKPFMMQSSRWNWASPVNLESASSTVAITDVPTGVAVLDATHPIFAGMGVSNGDQVELATGSDHAKLRILTPMFAWLGDNEANIIPLASVPAGDNFNYTISSPGSGVDASGETVIFEIKPNSTMNDGTVIAQKTIHIGVSEQADAYYTPQLLTIIKNAVDYVLDGGTGIKTPAVESNKAIVNKAYFDLTGKRVSANTKGFIIEKLYYEDGTTGSKKLFVYY